MNIGEEEHEEYEVTVPSVEPATAPVEPSPAPVQEPVPAGAPAE